MTTPSDGHCGGEGIREPVAGWRYFFCEDCKEHWKTQTRDCWSPSIDSCPCGSEVQPYKGETDPTICVDRSGNLLTTPVTKYLA